MINIFTKLEFKNIFLASVTLICAVLVATISMFLIYRIPIDLVKKNVHSSLNIYKVNPKWAPPHSSSQVESYGDTYLLLLSLTPSTNALNDAMLGRRLAYSQDDYPVKTIFNYFSKKQNKINYSYHPRYWHGSLVVLKPLLTMFTISEIRLINMVLQISLLIILSIQLFLKGGYKLLLPFLIGIFILNPVSCILSISYYSLYYITLLSCLFLLKYKIFSSLKYWYYFFLIGIITIFFDQFTYSLISLGFPLILLVILNNEEYIPKIKKVMIASISWLLGFIGMWIGKWSIASLITGQNVFINAFNKNQIYIFLLLY